MTPEQELEQLRAVGDCLQSEGSRLAEWAEGQGNLPYEVGLALWEVNRAVEQWTMIRAQSKPIPVSGFERKRLPQPPDWIEVKRGQVTSASRRSLPDGRYVPEASVGILARLEEWDVKD